MPNDFRGFISNCIQEHFIDFNNKNCTVVDLFNFDKPKSLTLKLSELIETNKVLIGQITESFKISHNKAIGIMSKLIFVPVYTDDNNKILPSTTKIQNDYISLLPITDSKIETENYFFAVAQVFCEEIYKSDSLNLNKSLVFGFQELLSIYFREKISVKSMKYPRLSFLDCACYEIIMNILIGKELHMISKSRVDDILNYIAELENELKCEHLDIIILEHLSRFDIYDFIARSRKNYVDSKIKFEINKIDLDELIDYFS
ncbi:MAG: hypothetical protein H7196_02885 [candidate division SR1 bacterium]|nr:hypothetical protein [candidate division SR1 bacterium]